MIFLKYFKRYIFYSSAECLVSYTPTTDVSSQLSAALTAAGEFAVVFIDTSIDDTSSFVTINKIPILCHVHVISLAIGVLLLFVVQCIFVV